MHSHESVATHMKGVQLSNIQMGVWIRWSGTVEWNGGMDYWNGILECPTHCRAM